MNKCSQELLDRANEIGEITSDGVYSVCYEDRLLHIQSACLIETLIDALAERSGKDFVPDDLMDTGKRNISLQKHQIAPRGTPKMRPLSDLRLKWWPSRGWDPS